MAYIGAEPVPGQNREVDDISSSFNGSTTAFTLQVSGVNVSPESANNILVNLGGVLQNPGTDYTIAASTITFTTAPASGLSFFALVLGAGINTATVADQTIGPSKLINTAVTAGSYTTADITVDAQGRITAAANGTIAEAEIANNAVTTNKIADQAVTLAKLPHGTSSNDGKFLRANNGADPTFETVTGTTINTNADNRVITGSGTANTLNGEANLTFDGNDLTITGTAPCVNLTDTDSDDYKISNTQGVLAIRDTTAGADRFVINDNGTGYFNSNFLVGGTTTSPGATFEIKNSFASVKINSDGANNDVNLFFKTGVGKENKINFGDNDDADIGIITYDHNGDHMKFITGTSERMRLNANGLQFNGDNAEANALDDYEEVAWTPSVLQGIDGGATHVIQRGWCVKIGAFVHASFLIRFSGTGNGNHFKLTGLPFTSANQPYSGQGYSSGGHVNFTNAHFNNSNMQMLFIPNNANNIEFYNGSGNNTSISGAGTNKDIYGTVAYRTDT